MPAAPLLLCAVACLAVAHLALFESWWPGQRPGQGPRDSAEELPGLVAGLKARNAQLVREVGELKSKLATAGSPNPTMRGSSSNGRTKPRTRERADTKTGVSLGGAARRSAPDEAPRAPTPTPTAEPYLKSGAQLYDALYRIGYHNGTRHHAGLLLRALDKMRKDFGFERGSSVLDVGCSHGGAVRELWRAGWLANGVDVSQYAILAANRELANRKKLVPRCAVQPCFQTSPAGRLPFASASFDFALSSDVLEHVEEAAIPRAVGEIARVVRRFALLKISNRGESGSKELSALKIGSGASLLPKQLHATIRGPDFWLDHLETAGLYVHSMLEQEDLKYAKGLPWECCSYVVRPARATDGAANEYGVRVHAGRYRANMSRASWFRNANRCLFGRAQC